MNSRLVAVFAVLVASIAFSSERVDGGAPATPKFTVLPDVIDDTPTKARVVRSIILNEQATNVQIEALVRSQYDQVYAMAGFKHKRSPSQVGIYVYASEEQAKAGQALWLGMLWTADTSGPTPAISINESRIKTAWAAPETRFALSETLRMAVYNDLVRAGDRATAESMQRYPNDAMKQIDLERSLGDRYKADVARKHKLTPDQLSAIAVEAYKKGWPSPKVPSTR